MGELQVGDQVFDEAGHPTNVTFVTEYQYGRDCYELVFANGDTVIADGEHQWEVSTVYDRRMAAKTNQLVTRTLTTNEIIELREKHPKRKVSIELAKPVNYLTKELPVDPYILGYWLGDGTSNEGQFTIGDADIEEVFQLFLERDITLHKTTIKYRYSTRGLRTQLRELGLINNKHIPDIYLQASIEQRLELLRGLLDSDGHFQTRDGVVEFCTCLPELANNFKELISSLGIKTTHSINSSSLYGVRKKDRHRFSFITYLKVFNLTRKDKNSKSLASYKKIAMYIKDINPVATRPVKCISVDSKNSLYLATKNYIVTHNTMSLAMQIIFKCVTDDGKDGTGHRALLVSPFQSQTEEVIDNIKKLCSMLDENPIISSKASPIHVIKFKNGSILKGFTAATNGDSIRGQPADSIFMDECLVGNTLIQTTSGLTQIKDIKINDKLISYEAGLLTENRVINSKFTGYKEVNKYTLENGFNISATNNHPVMTKEGWLPISKAKEIQIGSSLYSYNSTKEELLARLYGYSLGDGWLYKHYAGFSGDIEGLELIKQDISKLYPNKWTMNTHSRQTQSPKYGITGQTNSFTAGRELNTLLAEYGLITTGKKVDSSYQLSEKIKYGSLKVKAEFLGGLFGAEGTVACFPQIGYLPKPAVLTLHKNEILFEEHKIFMEELVELLKSLGISSTLYLNPKTKSVTKKITLSIDSNFNNTLQFYKTVPIRYTRDKSQKCLATLAYLYYLNNIKLNRQKLKQDLFDDRVLRVSWKQLELKYQQKISILKDILYNSKGSLPKKGVKRFDTWQKDFSASNYDNNFTKIVDVSETRIEPVYNLTVENSHSYIANGLVTHNCDDIPAKAITSISGVFMDNPDVEFWRSGTPKGELNLFNSSQDSQTKEFHYPSFVIPHYSDEIDRQIRADMDEVGYIQEALALYGISSAGIFQLNFIQRAQNKPKKITALDVMESRNSFIVILGVDWNHDKVGTRIVIIAYDKNDPQFYIIDKEKISVEGWTQQIAIDKIISLNRKYNCDHVFVDNGFGSTQIGDLRLFGEMQAGKVPKGHPDLKLLDVQAVDFGSSVEIKDPTSGATFKQGLKQFAVQNAVQILEKDLLTLDSTLDSDLIKQLKNYIQKSRNQGRVTYGYVSKKVGDHDLDAMMIAFYGFKKLYSSILGGAIETAMLRFGSYSSFNNPDNKNSNISRDYSNEAIPGISFSSKKTGLANNGRSVLQLYGRNKPKVLNNRYT